MLDPRLNQVVAVARHGSFTAAAKAVGVTQSAVTKSVADLERGIGYLLFRRTPNGAIPTEEGRAFIGRAEQLLDDARHLLSPLETPVDPYAGVLRIGVSPASLEWVLLQPLGRLLGRRDSVRYDIVSSSFAPMIQEVRNGGVDFAVGPQPAFDQWADLRCEPIGSLQVALFVRKGHPLCAGDISADRDITPFAFVSPSASKPYGDVIRDIYVREGIDWAQKLHIVDYFPAVCRIVASSDAIGYVTEDYAATPGFRKAFAVLGGYNPLPPLALCAAYRARWDPKPATRAFIALLREALGGSDG